METKNYKKLITGWPRSGTVFTYHATRRAGKPYGIGVSHESEAGNHIHVWPISGVAIANINIPERYDVVLHQTRDPTMVWRSWKTLGLKHRVHIAGKNHGHPLAFERAYKKWYYEAEKYADYTYKVEEIREKWPLILELLEIPQQPFPDGAWNTNTRRHQARYQDRLKPSKEFAEWMEEIGYAVPDL